MKQFRQKRGDLLIYLSLYCFSIKLECGVLGTLRGEDLKDFVRCASRAHLPARFLFTRVLAAWPLS